MENDAVLWNTEAEDRERGKDWLTALVPPVIVALIYYRWEAFVILLLSVGGYLAADILLARPCGRPLGERRLVPAFFGGILAGLCLPASAPFFLPALLGGLTAVVADAPVILRRFYPQHPLARPVLMPAMTAYLICRLIFPGVFACNTVPAQWAGLDGVSVATPLASAAAGQSTASLWQLFFGIHAGAIGEVCIAAVLICALYLLLQRRLRLIAPAVFLGVIALFSVGGGVLKGLCSGSAVFGALLIADRAFAPHRAEEQVLTGLIAGVIAGIFRVTGGWTEGTAVAVLTAGALTPLAPFLCPRIGRAARWVWGYIRRFSLWLWGKIRRFSVWAWKRICTLTQKILKKIQKPKNNG